MPPPPPSATGGGRTVIDIDDIRQPTTRPLPDRQEDVRQWLAISLTAILALEVTVALLAAAICSNSWPHMKDVLIVIFGPTVALVGSATGFYFGSKADSHHK